jgi:hypothetical protein
LNRFPYFGIQNTRDPLQSKIVIAILDQFTAAFISEYRAWGFGTRAASECQKLVWGAVDLGAENINIIKRDDSQ